MNFIKTKVGELFYHHSPNNKSQHKNSSSSDVFEVIGEQNQKDSSRESGYFILQQKPQSKYYLLQNQFFNDVFVEKQEPARILNSQQWDKIQQNKNFEGINKRNLYFSIFKGIPFEVRKELWQILADTNALKKQHKKTYHELLNQPCKSADIISKDVPRTGPQNKYQKQLKNILTAYSNLDSAGYTQGMNFICYSIIRLLSLTNDQMLEKLQFEIIQNNFEERVFWIFVGVMYGKNWRECFQNMVGVKRMLKILQCLMEKYLPQILYHIKSHDMDLNMCFAQYYLTLIIYNTPYNFAKRILDLFFLQGEKVIHTLIMRMIKINQHKILNMDDMGQLITYFKVGMLEESCKIIEEQSEKANKLQDFTLNFFTLSSQ